MLSETVGRSRRHWPSHCWLKRTTQGVQLPADDFCMRVYKFHYAHVNFRIILAYFLHLSALLDKIEKIIISLAQRQTGAMSGWICSCSMFIFLPFAQWKDTINFYNWGILRCYQMSNSVGIFSLYQETLLGQFIYSYTTEFRPQGKRRVKNKTSCGPIV